MRERDEVELGTNRSECFKNLSAQLLAQVSYGYVVASVGGGKDESMAMETRCTGEKLRRTSLVLNALLQDAQHISIVPTTCRLRGTDLVKSLQHVLKHRSTRFWYKAMKSFICGWRVC